MLFVQNDTLLSTLVPIGNSGWSWSTPAQITAREMRELLRTEAFVRFAIQRTDLETQMQEGPQVAEETIWEFRNAVSVSEAGDNLVGFSSSHEDPEIAHQIATATIEAYTEWKLNAERQESEVAQAFFAEQLEPYQQELDAARSELEAYLAEHPAPVRGGRPEAEALEIGQLQAAVEEATTRVKETQDKELEARLALSKAESNASQAYTLIDVPKVPTEPNSSLKDLVQKSLIFVVFGVALSGACIVGSMLLDRSFRLPIDVRHGLDLPVLATIPLARLSAAQAAAEDERQHIVRDYEQTAGPLHPMTLTADRQSSNGHYELESDTADQAASDTMEAAQPPSAAHRTRHQNQPAVTMKDAVNA
jgi:capsular polysaccharide biosynthesis protein